ncbi:apiosidase-like domain-containing protein [Kineococcus sp. SYSU DK001]|uniref:apiosidase-like domain-containing protein n=1 Tax=Kineococcus sp. SYSU DK001 TaxID=3383122 RepID=UPI003D7DEF27
MSTPWSSVEVALTATAPHADPYPGVDVEVVFTHTSGRVVRRPAFWDGGSTWRARFCAAGLAGTWAWTASASVDDPGLTGTGTLEVPAGAGDGVFEQHGFWRLSDEGRHLVHADGTPAFLVGDTAWALPWRATVEQAEVYAADRAAKGFNAVLLMSVQPDMRAVGPEDRGADGGFAVAFDDLPDGTLNRLRPGYFQHLDALVEVLRRHGIVPVFQPVFQGFGWKGLDVAGTVVPPAQYARYCRYLVARYGAGPSVWLVGADGTGDEPQVAAGGREVHAWDAYAHPTGIHYRPHTTADSHQDADWLDFQWCQTGHQGDHVPERVADMARNLPPRAVANGEPTYENTARTGFAAGWWQGHEAWSNLCAGATMGVVYGAGSLWQWQLHPGEAGQSPLFSAPGAGWREALAFEGSAYPGVLNRVLHGLPFTGARPDWSHTVNPRNLLVPGVFFLAYCHDGGDLRITVRDGVPDPYRVVDPRTGEVLERGVLDADGTVPGPRGAPRVVVFCRDFTGSALG